MTRYRLRTATFTLTILGALTLWSCDKSPVEAKAERPRSEKEHAAGTPPEETRSRSGEAKDATHANAMLASYESIRAALARDAVAPSTASAAALEKSARSAALNAAGEMKSQWTNLADAAKRLHETPKGDAESVRKAFGEVSRHLIIVLSAQRSLAEGLHVFECPMAQGYDKWVQPSPKISNPYMGTRMPECGSESSL
jgi:hypothetical protein